MKLSRLVELIRDDNIAVQYIEQSIIKIKENKKHNDFEITFATEYDILNSKDKIGLVIWLDRKDYKKAFEDDKKTR